MTSPLAAPPASSNERPAAVSIRVATTDAQRELWTASQLGPSASLSFNEAVAISLHGALNQPALESAIHTVVGRHESLRARVTSDGTMLEVLSAEVVSIDQFDLRGKSADEQASAVADHERLLVDTPFHLSTGPLVRFALLRLDEQRSLLTIAAHHIVCDGWSFGVIARELGTAYSALTATSAGTARVTLALADDLTAYAQAVDSEAREPEALVAEAYWVGQFRDEVAPLELPADHRRPPVRRFEAGRVDLLLDVALVATLRAQSADSGTTLFVTLLSGFAALLQRLSGQEEVIVGIPTAGQPRFGLRALVGHCVNLLPLRLQPHGDQSFDVLRRDVQRTLFDGLDHQQLTYGGLLAQLPIRRDPSRLPLVNVAFNLDQGLADSDLGFFGLAASFRSIPRTHENFELFLNAVESGPTITLELQYSASLFEAETVTRWLGSYVELLTAAVAAPASAVSRLPIVTAADHALLIRWQSGPALDVDEHRLVHHRVADMAFVVPHAVAVSVGQHRQSYAELDGTATRIARILRERGVGRETPVGVLLPRDIRLPAAFLGALRAGGAYVPLDPDLPIARLHFVIADAGIEHIITVKDVRELLPRERRLSVLDLDADAEMIAATIDEPIPPSPLDADANSTSFVIYTSGSTGTPKGCRNTHRALLNFVCANGTESGPTRSDVALALAATSFDASVGEMAMALTAGAQLIIVTRDIATDGARLAALMEAHRVTYMFATPASFRLLLSAGWVGSPSLTITCGGEAMSADLAASLLTRARTVWNVYGPSETAVWVTRALMSPVPARITIGSPMANTRLDVVDVHGAAVSIGVAGELWIAGAQVGSGYVNRDELTAHAFSADPLDGRVGAQRYRTGDRVRWLSTGHIEFLGRNDEQVKLRGYRIELGEIAARLNELAEIAAAVVIVRTDDASNERLVAYVQAAPGQVPRDADMRVHLAGLLPAYMVPQAFVTLSEFPLLPSGKIHRRALPAPVDSSTDSDAFRNPTTDTEKKLATAWARALRVARVSTDDDFFQLGGHSLLAAQLLADLRTRHSLEVPYRLFFEAPTIVQLAAAIDERAAAGTPDVRVPVVPRADRAPAKASLMQRRLYMLEALDPANRMVLAHGAAWRLRGALDADIIEAALRDVIDRHETLRSRFAMQDGTLLQIVEPSVPFTMHRLTVDRIPLAERDDAMLRAFAELRALPFELDAPPLFRAMLVRAGPTEHVLLTLQHGLVWDGWSFDVFLADLTAAYTARRLGQPPAWDALPVSFSDYSAWQETHFESPAMARQVDWWRTHLAGDLPVLELPTDYPRPANPSYGGGRAQLRLTAVEADHLRRAAQREGATLFQFLFAAFHVLLHRHSGQEDLLVGMPLRNRPTTEVAGLIGAFTNTVTLRSRITATDTFAAILRVLKADCVHVLEHQEMPFELLDRRAPVVRALFSMQDARSRPQVLDGCVIEQFALDEHTATNDLMLWTMEYPSSLLMVLSYRSDLFSAETADAMIVQFKSIAEEAAATPTRPVGHFSLSTGSEPPPRHTTSLGFDALFVTAADFARAVTWNDRGAVDHAALLARAQRATDALSALGIGDGDHILYRGRRDADLLTLTIAAICCGAQVVRLAADDSDDYLRAVLGNSSSRLLIADIAVADCPVSQTTMDSLIAQSELTQSDLTPGEMERSESAWSITAAAAEIGYAALVARPTSSGPHLQTMPGRALAAQARGLVEALALTTTDCVLDLVSAFGDGPPLIALATMMAQCGRVGDDDPLALEGEDIVRILSDSGGTVLFASVASLHELQRVAWSGNSALRVVLSGPCEHAQLVWLRERVATLHLAESASDFLGMLALRAGIDGARPRLLPTLEAKVVNDAGQETPTVVPGALTWSHPRHTTEFSPSRTPLRARRLPSGQIELLSVRSDDLWLPGGAQSRMRIAECLAAIAEAREATVALQTDTTGTAKLVGYLVGRNSATDAELRRRARSLLPTRAIPLQFVTLAQLPRTSGDEINIAQLPNPFRRESAPSRRLEPTSPHECMLALLWCEMLGLTSVKLTDNFFSLGGYSLLCFQLIDRIETQTGRRLNPRTVLFGTLEQLSLELAALR